MPTPDEHAILLVSAPDRRGLTALLSNLVYAAQGNIIDLQQHVDPIEKIFFLRLVWELQGFQIAKKQIQPWLAQRLPAQYQLQWRLHFSNDSMRIAIMGTKEAHCLYDIIARVQSGEWQVTIPIIISNHADLQPIAQRYGIAYQTIPITKNRKMEQEAKIMTVLAQHKIDLVVLARYMQILCANMTKEYENRIINIHHSFLPAFPGSRPYHSAYQRGVKIIGATSHYVTCDLDAGPIIAQDVITVSHLDSVADYIRKGADIEKLVFARAISAHIQHKILVSRNRTVVFY